MQTGAGGVMVGSSGVLVDGIGAVYQSYDGSSVNRCEFLGADTEQTPPVDFMGFVVAKAQGYVLKWEKQQTTIIIK